MMSPSEKQIKLWKMFYDKYHLNKEDWDEYLYDIGVLVYLNGVENEFDIPNPSGEGKIKIPPEVAEEILNFGMPWRVCDTFKKNT